MRNLDRVLVVVLAVGVWALVLKPTSTTAHLENYHQCQISGTAEGSLHRGLIVVDGWLGVSVDCFH